ncbi:MAG: DUF4157 domain-containing protein [Cyclobacteriaceae bacterium]
MNIHADKTQEKKKQSVANGLSQKQRGGESTFQFVDNRYAAVAQRKLQEMANNSPQAKQVAQLQAIADNYSARRLHPIQKKENNTGLPDNLKSSIENLSGYSMDDVKVHYNSDKPAQLNAHAYAQGTDIHLASGQEKHLPHEAWHVVQQKQGRVKPTRQMKGKVNVNDDAGLEKEADEMGELANSINSEEDLSQGSMTHGSIGSKVVQREVNIQGKKYEGIPDGWDEIEIEVKDVVLRWIQSGEKYTFRDEVEAILMAQIVDETGKNLPPNLLLDIYKHTDYDGLNSLVADLELAELTELAALEKIHSSDNFKNFIALSHDEIKRLLPLVELEAKITHLTVFSAPSGNPASRKDVAVGEVVDFKGNMPGDWTADKGDPANRGANNDFKWTAPNRAATAKITLEFKAMTKKEASVNMNVVEPDAVVGTKISDVNDGFRDGYAGVGMEVQFTYRPLNVSFGNIKVKEVSGPATNVSGYYKKVQESGDDLYHDSGDHFTQIKENNEDSAADQVSTIEETLKPYEDGTYDWVIPNHFKVKGEGGDKYFTDVTQAHQIWASGKLKITKAGAEVERTP